MYLTQYSVNVNYYYIYKTVKSINKILVYAKSFKERRHIINTLEGYI